MADRTEPDAALDAADGTSRRTFLGFLIAAPTLAAGATLVAGSSPAEASVPTLPQPADIFDLGDLQNLAALATSGLIAVQVHEDGTASFALHRTEVGQGITTAVAMMIAEELDLPLEKVRVSLSDARPELLMNQLTGGSQSARPNSTPGPTAPPVAPPQPPATAPAPRQGP